jgi:hypothetical protein
MRWRQAGLYLHVHETNHAAVRLYESCGFSEIGADWLCLGERRCLMRKLLPTRAQLQSLEPGGAAPAGGNSSELEDSVCGAVRSDGVYVWGAAESESRASAQEGKAAEAGGCENRGPPG